MISCRKRHDAPVREHQPAEHYFLMVLRCYMWVRYAIKFVYDVPSPCWGRSAASFFSLAGQGIFLRITLIRKLHPNTPEGASPSGAAAFIVFGGMGASAPIFVILSIHVLPIQFSEEPFLIHIITHYAYTRPLSVQAHHHNVLYQGIFPCYQGNAQLPFFYDMRNTSPSSSGPDLNAMER